MLSEEKLKQAAEELAFALIESLLAPEQCHHQFSDSFEKKIQSLLLSYSFYTQTDDETKRL